MDPTLANALTSMARPAGPTSLNLSSNSAAIGQGNSASKNGQEEKARAAAQEFEAVFLTTMLEGMFEGLKTDGPFGGGSAEKTYRSLIVTEYAKQMSQNGGLGLSDQITRDLIALQEGAQK
jgi:flagellar protein FlgJ